MMRVFAWRQPRALLMLIVLLPGINAIAWAEAPRPYDKTVPVVRAAKPAKPYEHDNQFWLSLGAGGAVVSTYSGFAINGGLYGSSGNFVYGLRHSTTDDVIGSWNCFWDSFPFGSSSSGNCQAGSGRESALMLGGYLDRRHWSWAAIGISRVDGTGEHSPKDQRYIGAGLPLELVFSPPTGRYAAPEIRLNVDLNEKNSFAMLTLGLRLGQLK